MGISISILSQVLIKNSPAITISCIRTRPTPNPSVEPDFLSSQQRFRNIYGYTYPQEPTANYLI